jgi:hypothetical protein
MHGLSAFLILQDLQHGQILYQCRAGINPSARERFAKIKNYPELLNRNETLFICRSILAM